MYGKTVLTLGGAGGKIKTGMHVNAGGAPFQRAHITAMRAMGLTQAEIEIAGKVGFGEYAYQPGSSETDEDAALIQATGNRAEYTFRASDCVKYTSDTEKRAAIPGLLK